MVPIGSGRYLPPDFFLKESIKKLEKNILQLSEDQINDLLKEIYRLAQQDFFEISILSKFLKRITKKKEYYYHKQYPLSNWKRFLYKLLHLGRNPNYKEYTQYYEKYSFIEKKVQNRLNRVHQRYNAKNKHS